MEIKYEDIDRIISILENKKKELKKGESFTFSGNKKINENNNYKYDKLPNSWHIRVTESNKKILAKWRGCMLSALENHYIVGMTLGIKGHNPVTNIKGSNYDFGEEITLEEFKHHFKIE